MAANESGIRDRRCVSVTQMISHLPEEAASFKLISLDIKPLALKWTILRMVEPVSPELLLEVTSTEMESFPGCLRDWWRVHLV